MKKANNQDKEIHKRKAYNQDEKIHGRKAKRLTQEETLADIVNRGSIKPAFDPSPILLDSPASWHLSLWPSTPDASSSYAS
jgi:hypothetical protein